MWNLNLHSTRVSMHIYFWWFACILFQFILLDFEHVYLVGCVFVFVLSINHFWAFEMASSQAPIYMDSEPNQSNQCVCLCLCVSLCECVCVLYTLLPLMTLLLLNLSHCAHFHRANFEFIKYIFLFFHFLCIVLYVFFIVVVTNIYWSLTRLSYFNRTYYKYDIFEFVCICWVIILFVCYYWFVGFFFISFHLIFFCTLSLNPALNQHFDWSGHENTLCCCCFLVIYLSNFYFYYHYVFFSSSFFCFFLVCM